MRIILPQDSFSDDDCNESEKLSVGKDLPKRVRTRLIILMSRSLMMSAMRRIMFSRNKPQKACVDFQGECRRRC